MSATVRLKENKWDVIILGAGVSGLAAGRELKEKGIKFKILEARGRLGGRVFSVEKPGTPFAIELGAEFVHGSHNRTLEIVKKLGLPLVPLPMEAYGNHWEIEGRKALPKKDFAEHIESIFQRLKPPDIGDRSIAESLELTRPKNENKKLLAEAISFIEGFNAADIRKFSTRVFWRDEMKSQSALPRSLRLEKGYGDIIRYLSRDLPSEDSLELNTVVREIRWKKNNILIFAESSRGQKLPEIRARKLIITLPLSILKEGNVVFDPPLKEKKPLLDRLEMGHVQRVTLQFRDRFWENPKSWKRKLESDPAALSFLHAPHEMFPTWWTASPFKSPILVAWMGGSLVDKHRRSSPGLVKERALACAARIFGQNKAFIEQKIVEVFYHSWSTDPFSLGAYSYAGVGGEGARTELAFPLARTLFFAGEATSEYDPATVAGALEEGERAAREVIQEITRGT